MGTSCELTLYARDECRAAQAASAAISEVERIERAYSRYRTDSIVHSLNQAAKVAGSIVVDPETAELIDSAFDAYRRSDGLFDITSGVLREIWNDDTETVPSEAEVSRVLSSVGLHKVSWQRPCLAFTEPRMQIDLGGLAKEYAADRAAELCRSLGIAHGLVDLGGDLAVVGAHPDGSPWRIGIRDPRDGQKAIATLFVEQGGIATSGDYERCWEFEGRRYGHILDPRTGWPVKGMPSVTVAARKCLSAGLMSTIAVLKGDGGMAWLRDAGFAHVCVDASNRVDISALTAPEDATIRNWMRSTTGAASSIWPSLE
jgi:FAD:protein FMN transferase